VRNSVRAR